MVVVVCGLVRLIATAGLATDAPDEGSGPARRGLRCPIYPGQGAPSRIGVSEWSGLCRVGVASIRLNSRRRPFGR
jgi:hypothetical protein